MALFLVQPILRSAFLQDLAGDAELSGEAEDFEENLLMMLGLSKGQLILLNIQATEGLVDWWIGGLVIRLKKT